MSKRSDFFIKQYQEGLLKSGVLNEEQYANYEKAVGLAKAYNLKKTDDNFANLQEYMERLTPADNIVVSRLLMLDTMVLNSVQAYEDSLDTKTPNETFGDMFRKGLKLQEPERTAYYVTLEEKARDAVISSTHTLHPTIFYSAQMREFIRTLTMNLETFANPNAVGNAEVKVDLADPAGPELVNRFTKVREGLGQDAARDDVRAIARSAGSVVPAIIEFATDALKGKIPLVPLEKVTVANENKVEKTNTPDNKNSLNNAMSIMMKEREIFLKEHGAELSDEARAAVDKLKKPKSEWRTWAYNADADGRPEANLVNLIASTKQNITVVTEANRQNIGVTLGIDLDELRDPEKLKIGSKVYVGPILDARQNSSVHADTFSALIQLGFQNGDMENVADAFFKDVLKQQPPFRSNGEIFNPKHNIYQQLSEEDQVKFAKYLILQDKKLLPEGLTKDVETSVKFYEVYQQFLKDKGLDKDYPTNRISELKPGWRIELRQKLRTIGDDVIKLSTNGNNLETDFNIDQFLTANIRVLGKNAQPEKLEDYDKKVIMLDSIRRLNYISSVKDEVTNPERVCDRHQIANFESVADFYNMLALMKEAGTVEIQNGKVVRADIAIMPLLETIGDMKNGAKIFKELLDDPLTRSLFELNGNKVSLMVGFSDGAKSGGNLASLNGIYKCTKEIAKICNDAGFTLEILEGRGPSEDRGGSMISGIAKALMSDQVIRKPRFDVTNQADRPVRDAASPGRGERDSASAVARTLDHSVEAEMRIQRNDAKEQAAIASFETAWEFMAKVSSEEYDQLARSNPTAKKLIMESGKNPDATSRPLARAADPDWDDIRAITTEHAFAQTAMSLHNVGLKEAISEFISTGPSIKTLDGQDLRGEAALAYMYEHFEPWKALVEVQRGRVARHDPVIVRAGCEAFDLNPDGNSKVKQDLSAFATTVNRSIEGLSTVLARMAGDKEIVTDPTDTRNVLATIGHAQLFANADEAKPSLEKKHGKDAAEIVRSSFTAAVMPHQEARPTKGLEVMAR